MIDEWIDDSEVRAREAVAQNRFLALRRLFTKATNKKFVVGLVGPFPGPPHSSEVSIFTFLQRSRSRLFLQNTGDSFQALSMGLETCRLHLRRIIESHPDDLFDEFGRPYIPTEWPKNRIPSPGEPW